MLFSDYQIKYVSDINKHVLKEHSKSFNTVKDAAAERLEKVKIAIWLLSLLWLVNYFFCIGVSVGGSCGCVNIESSFLT